MPSTRFTIWGLAAGTALAAAAALFSTTARPSAVSLPALGNEARCQGYGGLPPGWRSDPHAGMLHLSSGEFTFGSERGYPDERPAGRAPVHVDGFWVDQTEVTVAEFKAFVEATGYVTEAEWEYAAKAGQAGAELDAAPHDAQGKPTANYWQGVFPAVDTAQDGHAGLAPVGCYAANAWGLHDTIGNAWEWTKDAYAGPHQAHLNGDTAAVAAPYHRHDQPFVIKGGSFLCSPDFCVRYRASAREQQEADLATAHIGFRTVRRDL